MGHAVDGFDLKFTSRRSWKAERRERGKVIDVVPVTWDDAWKRGTGANDITLEVWYQSPAEMELARRSREPFIIVLAAAKDRTTRPREFREFKGIFEVMATGDNLSEESINTRVLRRVVAGKGG